VVTQYNLDNWQAIGCENVLQVPYPYKDGGGKEWKIGEWVPMWKYLRDMDITDANVRELWFSNMFERWYTTKISAALVDETKDKLANQVCSAIRNHYRQTYRIDPYFMDRIERWETRRVAVIDTYSRTSPPSPCWCDYCVFPKQRIPTVAKRTAVWNRMAYNWIVNTRDPRRENPTPHTISVVNHALGIFRVVKPPLIDGVLSDIIPSALKESTIPNYALSDSTYMLTACHLAASHTLEALASVIWSTNRNSIFSANPAKIDSTEPPPLLPNLLEDKYYSVVLNYEHLGGTGPNIEYLSGLEYARWPYPDISAGSNSQVIESYPANAGMLDAISYSEAGRILNQYRNRISGISTFAGYAPFKCVGNIKGVVFQFTPGSGLETVVDMRETPPNPTMEQQLPQHVINFLHRHVTRADDRNTIGAPGA
jgi:hypothetical protein